MENLNADQLRERLLVAEALLKKIYNKNKELEEEVQKQKPRSVEENPDDYLQLLEEAKKREEELIKELEEQQKQVVELKSQ